MDLPIPASFPSWRLCAANLAHEAEKGLRCQDKRNVPPVFRELGKNENVNTEILEKICLALNCEFSDIMDLTRDEGGQEVDVTNE
ncbi:MAG: helix-turn-helix transcriptional regulator [Oscillospiraceae bacterium]|nr:helix-turn-helix transcriptional regulator [Oscillospiraceae bacterium]